MGFDACTTASNHAVDQGFEGLARTAELLEAQRRRARRHLPDGSRAPAAGDPDHRRRGADRLVAGTYGLNGFPLPEGSQWSVSMWDARNLLDQAERARQAGADIVVVHLHGGDEYVHLPERRAGRAGPRLTASPAVDLVLGEHAHVVQPITRVNGKWVVYGMGNMIAQQRPRPAAYLRGHPVRFEFRERRDGRFRVSEAAYVPTYWNRVLAAGNPIRIQRVVAGARERAAATWPGYGRRGRRSGRPSAGWAGPEGSRER